MKRLICFAACIIIFLLTGCASIKKTVITMVDAEIESPIAIPPVHVSIDNKPGDITISPAINFTAGKNYSKSLANKYSYSKIIKPRYFNCYFPEFRLGSDLDYQLSKTFAVFGGVNCSFSGDKTLLGANLGLGICFSRENVGALRVDLGVTFQEYYIKAVTVIEETEHYWFSKPKSVTYSCFDQGKHSKKNLFATLTLNTLINNSDFNYFFRLGYFYQNPLNYEPGTMSSFPWFTSGIPTYQYNVKIDNRPQFDCSFLNLTPGISYKIDEDIYLISSFHILSGILGEENRVSLFIAPMIQFDFRF